MMKTQTPPRALAYPDPADESIEPLETPLMLEARDRTLAAHRRRGQFVGWFGRSGVGKTTTGEWFKDRCNADADVGVPRAFRAAHFTMPVVRRWGNPEKQALGALFDGVTETPLDVRDYRWKSQREIAHLIAQYAVTNNIQMIFIDEAGRLCPEALEGILLFLNMVAAPPYDLPCTIVLIGMHDLPTTIDQLPQVATRVSDTINFRPYTRREAHALLRQVSPYFDALDPDAGEGARALDFVIEKTGGLVRSMLQLVERATRLADQFRRPLSMVSIMAVFEMKEHDHRSARDDAAHGYRGQIDVPSADDNEDDGPAGVQGGSRR